ncbi:MAG: cupin domain-containing protein [Candidatus Heimdallarchaeota archaeon]|nr:cupin domain-containing protein [Candidatus Heimdallarchaeota archaeon]
MPPSHKIYHLIDEEWVAVRPEFTTNISGKSILPKEWSDIKLTVTRVEPNGEFPMHKDPYHHIFYFISGIGKLYIEDKVFDILPNLVAEIPAGLVHGYKNTSHEEMILLTGNIPLKKLENG